MKLKATGTAILAGLITVVVLFGIGFYEHKARALDAEQGPKNCHCENWRECTIEDPGACTCCDKIGGCRPPKDPN